MVGYHCIDDDDDMAFQTIEHNFFDNEVILGKKNFMQLTNQNKTFPYKTKLSPTKYELIN
jgi:hypothetical protein